MLERIHSRGFMGDRERSNPSYNGNIEIMDSIIFWAH